MEKKFTWIPFYTELAKKLLEFKNNRSDLVKIVYELDEKYVNFIHNKDNSYVSDIDFFSFFSIFNRGITDENRKIICGFLKNKLNISAEIPLEFSSIPTMNNQQSTFYWRETANEQIPLLCSLFEAVFNNDLSLVEKLFDKALGFNGIKWNITMGFYWISPYNFMPLDSNSRNYLKNNGINIFDEKELNGKNYLNLLDEIKNCIQTGKIKEKSIPEISDNAWKSPTDFSDGEKSMQNNSLADNLTNLLQHTHNLILHGAPGTGKTFLAKEIAKRMDCTQDEIGFVQFHPSYDYTDFVEGLRPKNQSGGEIGFERKDGVFKEFCKRALLSKNATSDELKLLNPSATVWKVSLEGTGENPTRSDCMKNGWIRIGWCGYGNVEDFSEYDFDSSQEARRLQESGEAVGKKILQDFQNTMQVGDIVLSCYSKNEIDAIGIVTGDYEYKESGGDYPRYRNVNWLVKDIRENIVEINNGKTLTLSTVYKLNISVNDVFEIVKKYSKNPAVSDKPKAFLFIIDEINRGELSKIFGELFFCIDPGYRGKMNGTIKTQYQNLIEKGDEFYDGFFIPENVYIIGTMNDIDRSVDTMDFAFRRRFAFKEIKASENIEMLAELGEIADEAKTRLTTLNNEISKNTELSSPSSYHIGGAYFMKLKDFEGSNNECFQKLWDYHLEGLLKEYLRGTENAEENFEKLRKAYFGSKNFEITNEEN